MKIGVLGTGMVGQALSRRFVQLGHEVVMGARAEGNEKALEFARETGAGQGSFAHAAGFADIIVNATSGAHSVVALHGASAEKLAGKPLIDVSNGIDLAVQPARLLIANKDSLGEVIQRTFPEALVVKTLCTVTAAVMVDPGRVPGQHSVFLSGNDSGAKAKTGDLLSAMGWQSIIDLGDITSARAQEMMLPLWLRLWRHLGTAEFNYIISKA